MKKLVFLLIAIICVLAVDGKSVKVGKVVPDFSLSDESLRMHSLSQYRGKKVVLAFYPVGSIPYCRLEAEMLRAEFLEPMSISQRELADAIHVPYQRINELVNQKRGVTPSTALRLAKFFNVSADYWLNLQARWDLYWAQQSEKDDIESISDVNQIKRTDKHITA